MNDDDALVSLADVAEMAGVSRPAVSNWRRRNPDFPSPVAETGATSLFRLGDLKLWMAEHDKRLDVRSLDQLVWSALNPARGTVLPEEAAQAGMILLGYLALALRQDKSASSALRAAINEADQHALSEVLHRLDDQAVQLGLGALFPAQIATKWSSASRSFLAKVLDLAIEHGVSDAFEALIAAVGRGSRGLGEHTTPASIADLVMSLAAPIHGVLIDPACGYGTLLLAASKTATANLTMIGQDINSNACHVTRLRMFVHGLPADIICGDTLGSSMLPGDVEADFVVADPPLAMSWRPNLADTSKRMPYGVPPASRGDLAWLQDGISRLRPDGTAIFILGNGPVFRDGAEEEIRRHLIESRCIRAVVALPPSLYPTTSIAVSLWIVSNPPQAGEYRSGRNSILLVDASQLGNRRRNQTELSEADVAAITDCYRTWEAGEGPFGKGCVRAAAVPVAELLEADANLSPTRWIEDPTHDPEEQLRRIVTAGRELHAATTRFSDASFPIPPLAAERSNQQKSNWTISKVTDLAALIRPRRIDPDLLGTGTTPVIRVADIGPDLAITPGSRVDPGLVTGRLEFTQSGDVVVMADGAKPRAAVDHRGGAIVSAPLQVLRPKSLSVDPLILAALITSIAPKYAVGTTIPHVNLAALEVPWPAPGTAALLGQVLEMLDNQRREARAAIRALDQLSTQLVEGLHSGAIRLESPLPGERGHLW